MGRPERGPQDVTSGRFIRIRKLVAVDMALHGTRLILLEFGLGTPALVALGVFLVTRAFTADGRVSIGTLVFGVYSLGLALNYVPLLVHAVDLLRTRSAREEVSRELSEGGRTMRRFGVQSLFLFVPPVVLVLAIIQAMQDRQRSHGRA